MVLITGKMNANRSNARFEIMHLGMKQCKQHFASFFFSQTCEKSVRLCIHLYRSIQGSTLMFLAAKQSGLLLPDAAGPDQMFTNCLYQKLENALLHGFLQ